MTFEPELPEEVRGDQFETATPVQVEDVDEEESTTPFDNGANETHTEEPDVEDVTDLVTPHPHTVTQVVTEMKSLTATSTTPQMSPVATTSSGLTPASMSQPVSDAVGLHEDTEGSASHSDGSADSAAPPTPAAGSQSSVMTDETENREAELPSIPETLSLKPPAQTEDMEGSASGEDEASGQPPPEVVGSTSTPQLAHYTLPPQLPPAGVLVALQSVGPVSEAGSGVEQLSGEGESSVERGAEVTVLPATAAVTFGGTTPATTDRTEVTSARSHSAFPTRRPLAATGDKNHRPTSPPTPDDPHSHPTEARQEVTPSSTPYVSQPATSTTSPVVSHSTPEFVDYDKDVLSLVESLPRLPVTTVATETTQPAADPVNSLEAGTVTVRGT